MLLTACDIVEPPAPDDPVLVYDVRRGEWRPCETANTWPGDELLHEGHLFRVGDLGVEDLGPVDAEALKLADAVVDGDGGGNLVPSAEDWVLVLADEVQGAHHAPLADVVPGRRVAWGGVVFETLGAERVEAIERSGEVLARVSDAFVRQAPAVFDLAVRHANGVKETIRGTEEHPFWVPSLREWVELSDLEAGVVLQTHGGGEATVVGLSFLPGDVEVFNFEVEGVHNYFVRGAGGDGPGVLVHNGCGPTYEVQDGVRRAKATDILSDGQGTVSAHVRDASGELVETKDIPVGDLLSPHKDAIDVTSSPGAAKRFSSVVEGVREGATPPIEVTPGTTGTPIRDVGFE